MHLIWHFHVAPFDGFTSDAQGQTAAGMLIGMKL
jgi:hypothetical protein